MCHSRLFLMLLYIHESSPIQIQYLNNINNIHAGQSGKGGLDFEKHKLTFFLIIASLGPSKRMFGVGVLFSSSV